MEKFEICLIKVSQMFQRMHGTKNTLHTIDTQMIKKENCENSRTYKTKNTVHISLTSQDIYSSSFICHSVAVDIIDVESSLLSMRLICVPCLGKTSEWSWKITTDDSECTGEEVEFPGESICSVSLFSGENDMSRSPRHHWYFL